MDVLLVFRGLTTKKQSEIRATKGLQTQSETYLPLTASSHCQQILLDMKSNLRRFDPLPFHFPT